MSVGYVTWEGDAYMVLKCLKCEGHYSNRRCVSLQRLYLADFGKPVTTDPQWECKCGTMNEMKYHSDDCPCTLGVENPCELLNYSQKPGKMDERETSAAGTDALLEGIAKLIQEAQLSMGATHGLNGEEAIQLAAAYTLIIKARNGFRERAIDRLH